MSDAVIGRYKIDNYLMRMLRKEVYDHKGLIYGIGHAVYTISDPRALLLKEKARELAVEKGYQGTLEEWLASLNGEDGGKGEAGDDGDNGKSAYELAVENGYQGTLEEWLASLKGNTGSNGKSA